MHVRRLFLLVLPVLVTGSAVFAQESQLQDRLTVPKQGQLVIQQAILSDLEGAEMDTIADVLRLRDQIEAIAFDRQAILDWKLLDRLGLTVTHREIPPGPPGVNIELVQGPAWSQIEINYTADTIVHRKAYQSSERVKSSSPVARVEVQRDKSRVSVNHDEPDPEAKSSILPNSIFGRTSHTLDQTYRRQAKNGKMFYVADIGPYQHWLLAREDPDAILASATVKDDEVIACSLFCYLQDPSKASSFSVPRLVIDLQKRSNNRCYATMTLVDEADFLSPVPAQKLRVPVSAGATMTYHVGPRLFQAELPQDVNDMLSLSPEEMAKLMKAE